MPPLPPTSNAETGQPIPIDSGDPLFGVAERADQPHITRIAVIDIGSNSVRLVVFEGTTRSPAYFFNEKFDCGLGSALSTTGKLSKSGKESAMHALKRYARLVKSMEVDQTEAVATAAIREATDGPAFAKELTAQTGLPIRILSGADEGRYSAHGVLLGEPRAEGVVADVGGASLELCAVGNGQTGSSVTTPLGPMWLRSTGLEGAELRAHILATFAKTWPSEVAPGAPVYLVGGAWRAFAALAMSVEEYPLQVLHGYEISPELARKTAVMALSEPAEALIKAGVSRSRAEAMGLTAPVLLGLLERQRPERFIVSACGLREGVLHENLPAALRRDDPLTQSARFIERMQARIPGFGDELADWLEPLAGRLEIEPRVIRAASLLADVNWRVSPDYRSAASLTTATHANLFGLSHHERLTLAVALSYRYKKPKRLDALLPALERLDDGARTSAKALGKLIRLGAMLTGTARGFLKCIPLKVDEDTEALTLTLTPPLDELNSPLVEGRLASAANLLGLRPQLR